MRSLPECLGYPLRLAHEARLRKYCAGLLIFLQRWMHSNCSSMRCLICFKGRALAADPANLTLAAPLDHQL
jgi:hypothetical protein